MSQAINLKQIKRKEEKNADERKANQSLLYAFSKIMTKEWSFSRVISNTVKQDFYVSLNAMLKAGADLHSSLNIVVETHERSKSAVLFKDIREKIVSGSSLSEALRSSGKFTEHECISIQVGEETGKITEVFQELCVYFQKKVKQRQLLIAALVYPITIVAVAISAIVFMLSYVVPMFSDIFSRSGSDLPPITLAVIKSSHFLKHYSIPFFYFMTLLFIFCSWQRKKKWLRKLNAGLILKLPIIGGIIHKIYLAQFNQVMAMLISSDVALVRALQLVRLVIPHYSFQHQMEQVEYDVVEGMPLHSALAKHSFFPAKQVALVKVGEETNQLDYFLKQIAKQLSDEVEHQSAMLGKFIEPFIIIVLGLFVGLILIAMYLPLFQLGQKL